MAQLHITARITTLPDQEHVGTGSFGSSLHPAPGLGRSSSSIIAFSIVSFASAGAGRRKHGKLLAQCQGVFFVVGLISCAVAACDGSFFCKYGCLAVVGAETSLVAHEKDLAGGDASSPDGCSVRAELACVDCCRCNRSTDSLIRSEHSRETPEDDQLVETSRPERMGADPLAGISASGVPALLTGRTLGGQVPS